MQKANIIFIQCDSMDGRAMGCMGHPAMKRATPSLDRLASEGTLFWNTYTNNPICCPSRASMWSGLYTFHCEGWNNYKGLEPGAETFQTYLEAAGYNTGIFGKTDYLSGHHTIRARVSAWTRSANIMKPNYNMEPPEIIETQERQVHKHDWHTADKAIEWLKQAVKDGQPFFLYFGCNLPHPKFITSRYYLDFVDVDMVEIPPEDLDVHPVMEYQRINKNWRHGFDAETVKKVRSIYYAMIAETDAIVGSLMEAVDRLGIANNTYFIFTSDHGEMNMEHRQFYKMNMYEPSVRVPLIIRGPGVCRGAVRQELVSLIDIFPTLMDMAEIEGPANKDGVSLMPELYGEKNEWRPDYVFSEFHDSSLNTGAFMVRRGEWKYIAYPGYQPMLFNLKEDPWEVNNLANSNPEKVAEMDTLLMSITDYHAVDAKVKEYDRRAFAEWRNEQLRAGTYYDNMSRIFSGWDNLEPSQIQPWTQEDEDLIMEWLRKGR